MSSHATRELACAKCGHLNKAGHNHCTKCGARMYISCHNCGHSNPRVASRCGQCGRRLHRSLWRRINKRVFGQHPKVTAFQIILLIVFVALGYKTVVYLVEYKPPVYQGE